MWNKKPEPSKLRLESNDHHTREEKKSLPNKIKSFFSSRSLSADEGAMVFAYEMLGDLLARRFELHQADALAAACAKIIDPSALDVINYLSSRTSSDEMENANRALKPTIEKVGAEYFRPEEGERNWRLKLECSLVFERDQKIQMSLTRPLDWAYLPDIVRESYMREARKTYRLVLFPMIGPGDEK